MRNRKERNTKDPNIVLEYRGEPGKPFATLRTYLKFLQISGSVEFVGKGLVIDVVLVAAIP
jgi:hypothetical protein